ncbi:hypothetical protein BDP27DRAFT_1432812 [Rhodocollybia butyracea]|uniref:Uncharacterized protein n=1 Tax=Rhodocollybia butyracea TaxID=206335 RepID=A0A9P5P441_9AGAR|nr:hypothetical protein BDP27DRAFT_1432812 [Rhodocollybia butyracea]
MSVRETKLDLVYLWLGVSVLDLSVFFLTLLKTLKLRRETQGGVVTVLMRDGVLYFGIITLTNSANMLTFGVFDGYSLNNGNKGYMKGLLPVFANIIASVMMSRLMFNLRDGHGQVSSMDVDLWEASTHAWLDSQP